MKLHLGYMGLVLALMVGILVGIGTFTFGYGKGFSYFSTDPAACANCHIMQDQYDTWLKSSHHAVAGCIDCHLPHDLVGKYLAKGENGWNHSWAFTFQDFHEPIQIKPRNTRILLDNCLHCHTGVVHEMLQGQTVSADNVNCVSCHGDVGHAGHNRAAR